MADEPEGDDPGSMWRELARMEAEVVDPEEEATLVYDTDRVQAIRDEYLAKLRAKKGLPDPAAPSEPPPSPAAQPEPKPEPELPAPPKPLGEVDGPTYQLRKPVVVMADADEDAATQQVAPEEAKRMIATAKAAARAPASPAPSPTPASPAPSPPTPAAPSPPTPAAPSPPTPAAPALASPAPKAKAAFRAAQSLELDEESVIAAPSSTRGWLFVLGALLLTALVAYLASH